MKTIRMRARPWLVACMLLPLLGAPAVQAESTEERLQRLENELQELRQMLRQQQAQEPAPAIPQAAPPVAVEARPAPAPAAVSAPRGAYIRYFIQNEALDARSPGQARPLVQGRISDADTLSFDPSAYDVPGAGLISPYRDPASYRYVGLLVEGDLPITDPGEYEFVVYPQPAREGGASVTVRMSVQASVGAVQVVEFRDESRRRVQRGRVRLEAGLHPVRLWAVAVSDGFGPSPTASHLRLALKGPGDASPRPLRELLVPARAGH